MQSFESDVAIEFTKKIWPRNKFEVMQVAEFEQVKIFTILGCCRQTHIQDLKIDLMEALKEKYEHMGKIPQIISNDTVDFVTDGK